MHNQPALAKPIALLGGTFDPIHLGHLYIALKIQQTYDLAEVRFIPSAHPVHRDSPRASPEQRLTMLTYAIENEPTLKVDDCEIQRKGPSYTIDTLEILRQKFPSTPLCLILGLDAWSGFSTWHRYEDILHLCHIIIAMRPPYLLPQTGKLAELLKQFQTQDVSALHASLGGKILFHSTTSLDISATTIREMIAKGQNPQALLPPSVYNYIVKQHLYCDIK